MTLTSRIEMWPFTTKPRHLRYRSVADWIAGENIPENFVRVEDPAQRATYITQFAELRQQLYDEHVKTLPQAEQELIALGRHPSQSHRFAADAEPYAARLRDFLEDLGYRVADIRIGFYHCDLIVLSVWLVSKPDRDVLRTLPWLFQGFQVKYVVER